MNVLEFALAPDLLLFGHANLLVALACCASSRPSTSVQFVPSHRRPRHDVARFARQSLPVEAWFDRSCALTFVLPVEEVARHLQSGLVPDTFDDRCAFLAVR